MQLEVGLIEEIGTLVWNIHRIEAHLERCLEVVSGECGTWTELLVDFY